MTKSHIILMTAMTKLEVARIKGMPESDDLILRLTKCNLMKGNVHFPFRSVLYLPKNMYKHRHLPYLIGSKEWQENRHIGLIDDDELKTDMNEDDEVLESNEDSSIVDDVSEADDEESIHHHIINRGNCIFIMALKGTCNA